jgi:Pyruvate/2-oxoacid:ferredoxin oxidoreductase delta subunit
MSFIVSLMTMLDSMEGDAITVHRERCISVRNRNAHCLRCVEVCTSKAIACRDNEFELDSRRCIGCGTCVTACPTCALEMKNPSDEKLAWRIREVAAATDGRPVIACEPAMRILSAQTGKQGGGILGRRRKKAGAVCDTSRVCELPCLGRIDESVLVDLAAQGISEVALVCASCDRCQHATGGALMREVVQSVRSLLEAFGSTMTINIVSKFPEQALVVLSGAGRVDGPLVAQKGEALSDQEGGLSRRDFFKSLKDGSLRTIAAADSGAQASPDATAEETEVFSHLRAGADGTLPQFIPSRHVRVARSLARIGEPVAEEIEARTSGSVLIDTQRCDSCRMCAVFCPTGALSKTDEDNRYGVIYRASICVRCRLCEQICPHAAITVGTRVSVEQFLGKKSVCYRMKAPQWTPNQPDSMFEKMRLVIGADKEMCMF